MTRKIDQDVDAVLADAPAQIFRRHSNGGKPAVSEGLEPLGNHVRTQDLGITEHFNRIFIVGTQQRLEKIGHRMFSEIRRYVANTQSLAAIAMPN